MQVKCNWQNQIINDYVISDELPQIKIDQHNNANSFIHPKEKWINPYFEKISYEKYCKATYSDFYSQYLKNLADKMTCNQSELLSCRYHRSAWLPLYYPESVHSLDRNIKNIHFKCKCFYSFIFKSKNKKNT